MSAVPFDHLNPAHRRALGTDPARKATPGMPLNGQVVGRVTEAEQDFITRMAAACEMTLSAYVRNAVLHYSQTIIERIDAAKTPSSEVEIERPRKRAIPELDLPDDVQILRAADVCKRFRITKTTLWRWQQSGHFPAPIHLGPNVVGWRLSDVRDFLGSQPTVNGGDK